MPNPLTDELSPDAKAELAAIFAHMKRQLAVRYDQPALRSPVWLNNWDRPHEYRRGW